MLEIIDQHLKDTASPELYLCMEDAFDLFDKFNVLDYDLEYTDIMATGDNSAIDGVTDSIVETTIAICKNIVKSFSVELNSEIKLSEIINFLNTLVLVEDYENQEDIISAIAQASDNEDAFCSVLSTVSGIPAEVFAPMVESVSSTLIKVIRQHAQIFMDNKGQDPLDRTIVKEKFKDFITFIQKYKLENSKAYTLTNDELLIGMDFEFYYDLIISQLDLSDYKGTAYELYAISLLSNTTNLQSDAGTCLSKTLTSIDTVTGITVALQSITLSEHISKTSGIMQVEK